MKKYFALWYSRGPNWITGTPLRDQPLRAHLKYLQTLSNEGIVKMGGPFEGESAGLGVVEVDDIEEVHELVGWDPAVRCGLLTVEVFEWDRIV